MDGKTEAQREATHLLMSHTLVKGGAGIVLGTVTTEPLEPSPNHHLFKTPLSINSMYRGCWQLLPQSNLANRELCIVRMSFTGVQAESECLGWSLALPPSGRGPWVSGLSPSLGIPRCRWRLQQDLSGLAVKRKQSSHSDTGVQSQ